MKKITAILTLIVALFVSAAVSADTGEWFFKNNIRGDTRLIEMKMLGAHDAFTASLSSDSAVDDAGVKLGDSGAKAASSGFLWALGGLSSAKAQSADVDGLLNGGVRYFDVRLSRYESGGEFYTTHGRISDQFTGEGGIARKISAWIGEHPGEIVILDFQSLFDIETDDGSATQQSWKDLMTKLTSDGIINYVYTKNGSLMNYTYDSLTNCGARGAIVLFGQVTGSWADERYINRRDSDGYMRSLWTETTSYSDMYSKLSSEIDNIRSNTESYYYKLRVLQAQTTSSPLISKADENNIKMLADENYDDWMQVLPILMVDNATTDEGDFNALALEKLAKANRASAGGKYSSESNGVTLYGSNDNVPLGTSFAASLDGEKLTLSLDEGNITGEMTVRLAPSDKRREVYDENGNLLASTAADGSLEFNVSALGEYTVKQLDEEAPFAVAKPLLRYTFTGESPLADLSGNGYDASAVGSPVLGDGKAVLSPDNVIKLPAGLTRNMKNYTVSSWVYVNSPTSGSRLFDIGREAHGSVFARLSSGDTSAGYKNTTTKQATGSAVSSGKWVHVANTYNSSTKTLSLYVDGKLVASQSASENPTPDSINDYLNPNGSFIGRTQWYFVDANRADNPDINASVADFRIYGETLSASEIARLARTVTVNFIDENGDKIAPSTEISVADAEGGYEDYSEKIGDYAFVELEWAGDVDVSNEINVVYENTALHIEITRTATSAEVKLVGEAPENAVLIAAAYDGERLVAVKTAAATEGALTLEAGEEYTVKAFLWGKGTLTPLVNSQ